MWLYYFFFLFFIDSLRNLGNISNVKARQTITKIFDTVIIFAIFTGNNVQLEIPSELKPKNKVLGQGMATVRAGGLNVSCSSEFTLNSNGICSWVKNIENSPYNGAFGFVYFSYKI